MAAILNEGEKNEPVRAPRIPKFLAASPVLAGFRALQPCRRTVRHGRTGARSAAEALDVFDMRAAAQRLVPPAHWGYLQSGVDGEVTLRANETGYARYQLKARRFVDVSRMDLATEVLGTKMNTPIVLSPIGSLRAINPAGEVGAARAAKTKGALQMLSHAGVVRRGRRHRQRGARPSGSSSTTNRFEATKKLLERAENAGCPSCSSPSTRLPDETPSPLSASVAKTRAIAASVIRSTSAAIRARAWARSRCSTASTCRAWDWCRRRSPGTSSLVSRTTRA